MIAKSGFELCFLKPGANLEIEAQKRLTIALSMICPWFPDIRISDFVQKSDIVSKRTVARPKHCLSPASVSTPRSTKFVLEADNTRDIRSTLPFRSMSLIAWTTHGLDPAWPNPT